MKLLTYAILMLTTAIFSLEMISAQAMETGKVFIIGLDSGGENLEAVKISNGETVHANVNSGVFFGDGFVVGMGNFEAQLTIGVKTNKGGGDADFYWLAVPVDLMLFYQVSNFRVGLGLTKHYLPRLESRSNIFTRSGTQYDNSDGDIAQIGWEPTGGNFSIDLRFTAIKFKEKNVSNAPELNGNVIGLYFVGKL